MNFPSRSLGSAALLALVAGGGCSLITNSDGLTGAVPDAGAGASTSSTSSSTSSNTTSGTGGAGSSSSGGGGTGGTGGGLNCVPPPGQVYKGLVINEVSPDGIPTGWIELKNTTDGDLELCGVHVTKGFNGASVPVGEFRFTFVDATTLGPDEYEVFQPPFNMFDSQFDRFTLFTPGGSVVDDPTWLLSTDGMVPMNSSWARIPDGCGDHEVTAAPTQGTPNPSGGDPECTGGAGGN